MSKFLDRLEQISRSAPAPLGFGVTRAQKTPAMALVGLVTEDYSSGMGTISELALDAALIVGSGDTSTFAELAQPLGGRVPCGVRLGSLTEEEPQAYQDSGCDVLAFPLEGTSVAAVVSEEMARVLCLDVGIEESELRAIATLPVDALLLTMADRSGPWTLGDLASLGAISRRVGDKFILVEVSETPGKKELEALRGMGVHGLVLDVGKVSSEALAGLKRDLLELPRPSPGRRRRSDAIVPSSIALLGEPAGGQEEEGDDDEEDVT